MSIGGRTTMATEPTPKDRCTSVDLVAVVREARRLVGSRLEKAFDLEPAGLGLVFRGREAGKAEVRIVPGRYAAVVPAGQEHADGLSPLARSVRRIAAGATLRQIAEPAGERYLELELSRASDSEPTIVGAELFGTGNIVVSRGGRLVAVQHARRWARRDVRVGAAYARPPAREDAFAVGVAEIEAELARSRTDLASTLAARLALGGPVAEEVIARGGWNGSSAASPQAHDLAPIVHRILTELLGEVGDAPKGYVVRRDSVPIDAAPYRSRRWAGVERTEETERTSFSEAEVEFFGTILRPTVSPEEASRAAERASLERQLERQQRALRELSEAASARRQDADAVLAHYADAEAALRAALAGDRATSTVRVELGERPVDLPRAPGPREAATSLYEESKRLATKVAGARDAVAATEAKLARAGLAPPPAPGATPKETRHRPPRWFEKFRWFVSSEGALVLAGRDAASNDLLVRRHLNEQDVYVHADLHGAASVVVKRPDGASPVEEPTLREAAQFAAAFSKAWRAGLASVSAFWAHPDQVSKAAASGEFVPRGAWVVRGTKHFVRDVRLELAIGTVSYDRDDYLSVAPPDALRARGTVRFLLGPADERDRGEREIELASELGVPRTLLQSLLPAGGLSVRRP